MPPTAAAVVSSLTEAFSCPICHSVLQAPVLLPCDHVFCSLCIRRHLSTHSVCPYPHCRRPATSTSLHPLRPIDRALQHLRPPPPANVHQSLAQIPHPPPPFEPLAFLSHKDTAAKSRYIQRLRRFALSTEGSVETLAARDKDLVLRWNANLDSAFRRSPAQIAHDVKTAERHHQRERKRLAHAATAAFFTTKKKKPTQLDHLAPEEGDSFDTLIRKLRARNAIQKGKDAQNSPPQNTPLPRTHSPLSTLPPPPPQQPQSRDTSPRNGPRPTVPVVSLIESPSPPRAPAVSLIEPPSPPSVPPSPTELHTGRMRVGGGIDVGEEANAQCVMDGGTGEVVGDTAGTAVQSGERIAVAGRGDAFDLRVDVAVVASPRKRPRPMEHPSAKPLSVEGVEEHGVMGRPLKKSMACVEGGVDGGNGVRELSGGVGKVVGGSSQLSCGAELSKAAIVGGIGGGNTGDLGRAERVASPYFSTPGASRRKGGFAQDTTPTSRGPAAQDASQRETQALVTPNSNEGEGSAVKNGTRGFMGTPGKDGSPLLGGEGRVNPAFLDSFVRARNGGPSAAAITDEQRQRIERNRRAAIEKKMKYMEKQRQRKFGHMRQPDL